MNRYVIICIAYLTITLLHQSLVYCRLRNLAALFLFFYKLIHLLVWVYHSWNRLLGKLYLSSRIKIAEIIYKVLGPDYFLLPQFVIYGTKFCQQIKHFINLFMVTQTSCSQKMPIRFIVTVKEMTLGIS